MVDSKYLRIAAEIRAAIDSGLLPPGTVMASSAQLCQHYQCARMTLRQGMALLAQEGRLRLGRGRNALVLPPPYRAARESLLDGFDAAAPPPLAEPGPEPEPGPGVEDLQRALRAARKECDLLLAQVKAVGPPVTRAQLAALHRAVLTVSVLVDELAGSDG